MAKSKELQNYDDKDDIVANLYALRAGLSVMSRSYDNIFSCESKIKSANGKLSEAVSNYNTSSKRLSKLTSEIDEEIKKKGWLAKEVDNLKCEYNDRIKERHKRKRRAIKPIFSSKTSIFLYISVIVFITLLILTCTLPFVGDVNGGVIAIIGVILNIDMIVMIINIVVFIREIRECGKKEKKENNELEKSIQDKKSEMDSITKKIENLEKNIDECRYNKGSAEEKKSTVEKEVSIKIDQLNSNIENEVHNVSAYGRALETTYAKLLNPADWHNVDLCIFYLQTGRADSIKECLQLVDRQRQNDEIVGAINAASERICGEIRGGFAALGSTMVSCINALSGQIEVMCNTLNAQHEDIRNTLNTHHEQKLQVLESVNAKNAEILTATQLNNALLQKANESSEEMMRDYKYVQSKYGIYI